MLFNFIPQSETVAGVTVRGLSLADFHTLIQKGHGELVFALLSAGLDLQTLLARGPVAAGDVIAVAADRPDDASTFARFPVGDQIRLLTAVYRLTVGEIDLGNVLRRLVEAIPTWAAEMRANSPI